MVELNVHQSLSHFDSNARGPLDNCAKFLACCGEKQSGSRENELRTQSKREKEKHTMRVYSNN